MSEQWQIGLKKARYTSAKTTQRLTHSAAIPLARRYKSKIVFQTKSLAGMWATDTIDRKVKYLGGNQYAHGFSNRTYFAGIYLMSKNSDAGKALKMFVMELGVPE